MTKQEATDKAIERIKGQEVSPGTKVATNLDPLIWVFSHYDGDMAVCKIDDKVQAFPRAEVFDVKKLINVANHYLNLGFWAEGMESTILTINK